MGESWEDRTLSDPLEAAAMEGGSLAIADGSTSVGEGTLEGLDPGIVSAAPQPPSDCDLN